YLHVMLITAVIGLTAGFIGKKYRDWALIALLILYAVINSYRPVFLRVTILSILMIFWKRRYGYAVFSDMMSLTIMIIGFSNPLILFDGGFVISVCASALIRYFYKPVYGMLSGNAYVRNGLTMGLIFTIGTLPLGAYFFGGVSLYSVIATIIFIPPVLGIILSFPIVFVLTSIFGCAPLASGFMTVMTYIIMYVPRLMDKLISSYIILPRPSLVFIAAYALAVAAAGFYMHKKKKYFSYALFVSAALFSSVIASQIMRLNTVEVTFVNVGQGDGAIIDVPYRGSILIDGGGGSEYSTYNIGEKVFVPYLETQGIVKIEAAFVSHYHKDHIEGIIATIENLRVRNVFMPDVMPENKYRKAIEEAAAANNTKIYYISEDTRVLFDNGLTVSITVPTAKTALISDDENDTSLLYNVEYGEFSCLFTGDMSSFAERNLAAENKAFDCDVLKVAHHGSDTSTSTEWLEAVSPEYAVISVGENNAYDLPDEDVLERLDGIRVLRTDKNGDIKITADMRGIKRVDSYRR
ncbi:MAG: DNA internalization-related competence protein ComEC/Rec2, partial [Oscillospiraceae bacterium]|nr:DNA internalization-related competence protein ComEC/Rec2 [Oscillospiraceae bacterium]